MQKWLLIVGLCAVSVLGLSWESKAEKIILGPTCGGTCFDALQTCGHQAYYDKIGTSAECRAAFSRCTAECPK